MRSAKRQKTISIFAAMCIALSSLSMVVMAEPGEKSSSVAAIETSLPDQSNSEVVPEAVTDLNENGKTLEPISGEATQTEVPTIADNIQVLQDNTELNKSL